MKLPFAMATVLAAFVPSLGFAQAVGDKPALTLDPIKAYVMYTTNRLGQAMELIREPDADDIAKYKEARAKAFVKVHKKYVGKLREWEALRDPATRTASVVPGPRPVEPTEATFAFHPIELDTIVTMGPLNRFSKAGDRSIYLQEIVPGTYTVYGPVLAVANGAAVGDCLCMGTVRFKVEPGVVTDMGYMTLNLYEANHKAEGGGGRTIKDAVDLPEGTTSFAIDPRPIVADARIGTYPVRAARYFPAGKRPNWHGVAVDRLTAMPGVFRYERDKMIDLTGGRK